MNEYILLLATFLLLFSLTVCITQRSSQRVLANDIPGTSIIHT